MLGNVHALHRAFRALVLTPHKRQLEGQHADEGQKQGVDGLVAEQRGKRGDGVSQSLGVNVLHYNIVADNVDDGVLPVEDVGKKHEDSDKTHKHLHGLEVAGTSAVEIIAHHVAGAEKKGAGRAEEDVVARNESGENALEHVPEDEPPCGSRLPTLGTEVAAIVRTAVDAFPFGCINGKRRLALQTVSL